MNVLVALALALPALAPEAPRVIVVSFDGAGYALTSRLLAEGRLPSFERIVREGAWSDGMVTTFPTKTAAAHALLFTGRYGHANGITGNSVLKLPPQSGSRLESQNGFFSTALRAEPVWSLSAEAGLDTYVFHAPQLYPFRPAPHLFALHGYTEAQSRGELLEPDRVLASVPEAATWEIPEARGGEAKEIRFQVGDSSFRGLLFDDSFDPTLGCDTLGVAREDDGTIFLARVKPGEDERFSVPIAAEVQGKDVWFSLRLFELSPDGEDFVLYRTGAVEMARSPVDFAGAEPIALDAYSGNGGGVAYSSGGLGRTLPEGGRGTAERRFLETEEQLVSQLIAQAEIALSRDYRLVMLYSPVTDDVLHQLAGYLEPELEGYDESLAEKIWPVVVRAFELQDRFLAVLLEAAERDSAHVLVVSDHGMAATNKLLHLNVALYEAGLLALDADRSIDLAKTRALALPLSDASVAVNTDDRPGGIVPVSEREDVLRELRRTLESLVDPETGERVLLRVFEPSTSGLLQPGGPTTGDLFLDFTPGYYPSTETAAQSVVSRTEPRGEHIFVPTRREMLAIFGILGPRVAPGASLGRVRGLDVAPTILDLLGLEPPADLPGKSLVPQRGILN